MEIYNCKVLVGGSRENEVRKYAVPAPEVEVLRHIHGFDAVLEITHAGSSPIGDAQVRDMLALSYGPPSVDASRQGVKILRDVFGPPSAMLPQTVEGVPMLEKKKALPVAHVTRWRDMRPEEEIRSDEPSFAD